MPGAIAQPAQPAAPSVPGVPAPALTPDRAPPVNAASESRPVAAEPLNPARLARIQAALQAARLDGWLFYDFRGSDPISWRVLGLEPGTAVHSRRWFCLIPARGQPRKLVHAIEPHSLDSVPGTTATYAAWRVRDHELGRMLQGVRRLAVQYSPRGDIPYIGTVDAGTVELIRSLGPEVVSSGDLVAQIGSVLSPAELQSQAAAAALLSASMEATAQEAARRVRAGNPATERELGDYALSLWAQSGLQSDGRPGAAVDAHSADPHYSAPEHGSAPAGRNSLLLIDWVARLGPTGIYADLTRTYWLGERTPSEVERVAGVVFRARDAALALVTKRWQQGAPLTGAEVDDEARRVVVEAGFGDKFIHRTGHNIGQRDHGDGVHNDNFETRDARRHLANTCFSIEPGIYLPNRFGIRSEIDVCLLDKGVVEVRPNILQSTVPALLQ